MDKNRFETQKHVVNLDPKVHNIQAFFTVEDLKWLMEQAEKSGAVYSRHMLMHIIEKQKQEIDKLKDKEELLVKLIDACNKHIGTEEQSEFIHVFRQVIVGHHMDKNSQIEK